MPKCHVCGGSEFVQEEGFLYCSECQTQCKGVTEQVFDCWRSGAQIESRVTIKKQQKSTDEEDKWTTWEAYNYVLKGMVDELLTLGASSDLKAVVFQLWTRYLQRIDVAFLKTAKKLPKLGVAFSERDANVLYSWPVKSKSRKKRSKRNATDASSETFLSRSRARTKAKKALVRAQYDKESSFGSDLDSSFFSEQSSVSSSGFSHSSTLKLLSRKNKYMTDDAVSFHKRVKSRERSLKKEPWKKKIRVLPTNTTFLCKVKLLAIIHLGLILCRDDIQLSDLLRWIREGHLSYCSVLHFLPPKMIAKGKHIRGLEFKPVWPSHSSVRKVAGTLVMELKIDALPIPYLPDLIQRYTKELELPGYVADFAINILADCQPKMPLKSEVDRESLLQFSKVCNAVGKELPNYEGRAMAFLLFSLKLIFGLDGYSEECLSKFAAKANKILGLSDDTVPSASIESGSSTCKLFVWKDWVNYIEFRNSLISRWHYPMYAVQDPGIFQMDHEKKNVIPKLPPTQNALKYLDFCQYAIESKALEKNRKRDPKWMEFMKWHLKELTEMFPVENFNTLKFQPSTTPCLSYMKELLKGNANSWLNEIGTTKNGPCKELLRAEFRSTSLDFILKPDLVIKALRQKDVHVKITKSSALGGKYSEHVKFHEHISSGNIRKRNTNDMLLVNLDSQFGEEKVKELDWLAVIDRNQFLKKIQSIESNDEVVEPEGKKFKSSRGKRKCIKVKPRANGSESGLSQCEREASNATCTLELFLPYRQVWMLYGAFHDITEEKFSDICSRMPSSFSWLLSLCSSLLEMSEMSLYDELVNVELVCKHIKHCIGSNAQTKRYECFRTSIALATW